MPVPKVCLHCSSYSLYITSDEAKLSLSVTIYNTSVFFLFKYKYCVYVFFCVYVLGCVFVAVCVCVYFFPSNPENADKIV